MVAWWYYKVKQAGDTEQHQITWYITRLPDGRWAAWDDAEISLNRVKYFDTRQEAVEFHRKGFEAAGLEEEAWQL